MNWYDRWRSAALFYQKHHAAGDISFHSQEDTDHYLLFSSHQCSYFVSMGDLSLEKVSETYLDVLKEIGNIGAGNAMTALSQMLNCKVDMKVPQVKLLDFNEVGALMGGEEQVMVGVFLGVEGDITGIMIVSGRTGQRQASSP